MPAPALPTIPSLQELMDTTPLAGRAPGLLLGIVLLGWGGRLYRFFVLLPGLAAGVWIAATARPLLGMSGQGALILGAVLAGAGALACHFVEGVAVRLMGAVLGAGMSAWLWPVLSRASLPWYLPLAAGALLALVFPRIYRAALVPITALFGAQLVAWGLGHPTSAPIILGLAVLGSAAQWWLGRKSEE